MAVEVGDSAVEPGDARWVDLEVCRDLDGDPVTVRARVVNGEAAGPTAWFQGAVHGNEPVGGLAVREFVTSLDPGDVAGAVVGVPVANPPAFRERQRGAPVHIGAGDVNGAFPGSPDGSFPQQLAHALYEAAGVADCVVDLHSADEQLVMHTGFAYVPAVGGDTQARTRELAVAGGVPHVVELDPEEMSGFMVGELAREGTPALVVESGGGAQAFDWALDRYRTALSGVAADLGVVPDAETADDPEPTFHENLAFLFAHGGGYVETSVEGGDRVTEGQRLARVTDVTGDVVETFDAPFDGVVMAVRTFPTARPGDLVVELAPELGAGGYSNRPE